MGSHPTSVVEKGRRRDFAVPSIDVERTAPRISPATHEDRVGTSLVFPEAGTMNARVPLSIDGTSIGVVSRAGGARSVLQKDTVRHHQGRLSKACRTHSMDGSASGTRMVAHEQAIAHMQVIVEELDAKSSSVPRGVILERNVVKRRS